MAACGMFRDDAKHDANAEKLERFNRFELEAYLGEFVNDFDVDGIIEEATVMYGIHRYWSAKGDELDSIIQSHELVS